MNLDPFKDLLADPRNVSMFGVMDSKISDDKLEPAIVSSYDPVTHTADVRLLRTWDESTIKVKVGTRYQGSKPNTGEATAVYPGQLVDIQFNYGLASSPYNHGVIVGTKYTQKDHGPPAYAPFLQAGTGRATVYPAANGRTGNAEHTDDESNRSVTQTGKSNIEDWGNEQVSTHGAITTRAEDQVREAVVGMRKALSKLAAL